MFVHVFCCHSTPLADLPQGASKNCEIIAFIRSQVHNHKPYSVKLQLLLQATAQVEANVDVALRLLSPPLPRVSSPTLSCGVVTKLFASDIRFSTDEGATVLMAFRGIQADFPTRQCLQINRTGASTPCCGPFEGWTCVTLTIILLHAL